jgi:hypothetical protein
MRWRRITEEDLTLRDELGVEYPPRDLGRKLADTVFRSLGVVFLLVAVGLLWEAFH